jgi:hypothetical protein
VTQQQVRTNKYVFHNKSTTDCGAFVVWQCILYIYVMRVINFLFAKNHKKHSSLTKTVGALLLCVIIVSTLFFPRTTRALTGTFGNQQQIVVTLPEVTLSSVYSDGAMIGVTITPEVPAVDTDGDGSIGVLDTDEQKSWSVVSLATEATTANDFTLSDAVLMEVVQEATPQNPNPPILQTPVDVKIIAPYTQKTIQINGLTPNTPYKVRIAAPSTNGYYTTGYEKFTTKNDGSLVASAEQQNDPSDPNKKIPKGVPPCGFGVSVLGGENSSMMGCAAVIVYYGIYVPSSWLAMLGGYFLDFFMGYSISSDAYTASSFPEKGWGMLRDLANICFIFLLVYAGIRLILGIGKFNAKSMIVNVILMAILINFSLFFTKVIIDAGNIAARIFYNALEVKNKADGTPNVGIASEKAISVTLIDQVDPQKIMATAGDSASDVNTGSNTADENDYAGYFILISLLAAAVNIYFMFIFFSVGFLFVGRVLQLWISMITAPIACISYAAGSNFYDTWWKELWKSAFVAPIFLFFLYLIASFLKAGLVTGLFSNYNDKGFISVLMAVAVPFVLLVGLMKIAKDMAEEYSSKTGKMAASALGTAGKMAGGLAIGAVTGGASLVGSRSFGMVAKKAMTSERMERLNKTSATGGIRGFIADKKINVLKKTSESSFDIRNTKLGSVAQEKSGLKFNDKLLNSVNLGTANTKDGYKGEVERRQKERLEKGKNLKTSFKKDEDVKNYYAKEHTDYEAKLKADRTTWLAANAGKTEEDYKNSAEFDSFKKDNKKPPSTKDEATNHLREEYIKSLEKGSLYSQVSQKLGAIGTQNAAMGGVDVALLGGIAGAAAMAGAGAGVASFVGGSQATRDAEKGAISEIEKLIKTDSKLAEKESELKKKRSLIDGTGTIDGKNVTEKQTDLKTEISKLDVELGQLNQVIKKQNESLFEFSQNLAKASLGKKEDDKIVVKVDGKDVEKTVKEHKADEKTQKETLIAKTIEKNEATTKKKDKEGELTVINNLQSDADKLEKEIEGIKNKGKKGGEGGGAKKKEEK